METVKAIVLKSSLSDEISEYILVSYYEWEDENDEIRLTSMGNHAFDVRWTYFVSLVGPPREY